MTAVFYDAVHVVEVVWERVTEALFGLVELLLFAWELAKDGMAATQEG